MFMSSWFSSCFKSVVELNIIALFLKPCLTILISKTLFDYSYF